MWYQNIGSIFFVFTIKHVCDGQTNRHNHDPQDRASIADSRGKTIKLYIKIKESKDLRGYNMTTLIPKRASALFLSSFH